MLGLIISSSTVLILICTGLIMQKRHYKGTKALYSVSLAISSFFVFSGAVISLTMSPAFAAAGAATAYTLGSGLGFIAASIATSIACLGAGYAVANVGSAALGLVGEKPEMLGTTLIYLGLAEGIAIYGVIVSLLILQRL
jgi:V/A-type H+-transporting ATPase subunit K